MLSPRPARSQEIALVLGALLLLLFLSPVADWWAGAALPWVTPYALWMLVIVGALLIHRRDDRDEP
jgi:hypothetical protein